MIKKNEPRTYRDCRESPVSELGNPPPKLAFLTSVSDVSFDMDVNRLSGSALSPVDSRWSVAIDVRLLNELGSAPAGMAPLPTTCRVCSPTSSPSSGGMTAGTAGNVSCLKVKQIKGQ